MSLPCCCPSAALPCVLEVSTQWRPDRLEPRHQSPQRPQPARLPPALPPVPERPDHCEPCARKPWTVEWSGTSGACSGTWRWQTLQHELRLATSALESRRMHGRGSRDGSVGRRPSEAEND